MKLTMIFIVALVLTMLQLMSVIDVALAEWEWKNHAIIPNVPVTTVSTPRRKNTGKNTAMMYRMI
ncbi:MAG: hypothetical protein LBU85_09090 [Treponema sp.]|jgi:hypothetical protein|nr:hypothetical protein [Treponema sp.]